MLSRILVRKFKKSPFLSSILNFRKERRVRRTKLLQYAKSEKNRTIRVYYMSSHPAFQISLDRIPHFLITRS